jgi:hypothetical protein
MGSVSEYPGIDTAVAASGPGCVECEQQHGWWFHLRLCAQCGHIGCCDNSLGQHATDHAETTGHPVIASFEPGEYWFTTTATNRSMTAHGSRRQNITR